MAENNNKADNMEINLSESIDHMSDGIESDGEIAPNLGIH